MNESKIKDFLNSWTKGVIEIGKAHEEQKNFTEVAINFLNHHYAFEEDDVMFKPTFTSIRLFRNNFDEALSYFIAGENRACQEDKGFAIQPWTKVRFENTGMILENDRAIAMGNYFFTDTEGNEAKVEYTFGYKLIDGNLRIDLHHSSFPFNP